MTSPNLQSTKFHDIFGPHAKNLNKQAKDRRSGVARVACECMAKIILKWKSEYLRYSYSCMESMFELARIKIKVVHDSGLSVLKVLVKNCGDHKGIWVFGVHLIF